MFLAPFALTIFGFSTSSASSERFSRGASAGPVSGLLGFAGFFAGGFFVAFSALGLAGFLCSAILIKPCLLLLQGYGSRRPFCAAPCASAHLSTFAVHARVDRDGVVARDNN